MNGRSDGGRLGFPHPGSRALEAVVRAACLAALLAPASALAAPAPADGYEIVAVCLMNSLEEPITYEYRWGTDESWEWDRLEVGGEIEHRLEVDPRDAIPMLSVRFRRSFGDGSLRTMLRATRVTKALDELECEPIFATPSPEELAAQRQEMLRTAEDRWQRAAAGSEAPTSSTLDIYFDVSRRDRAVVRVWKLGEARPVVLGRISELREAARPAPISLWGEGRYLVEIFEHENLGRIDSFVLDAKDLPELTRLTPHHASP